MANPQDILSVLEPWDMWFRQRAEALAKQEVEGQAIAPQEYEKYFFDTLAPLCKVIKRFSAPVFSSSLGAEDQLLTYMLAKSNLLISNTGQNAVPETETEAGQTNPNNAVKVFTLDTGRLFPETYELIAKTQERYDFHIQVFFPNAQQVEQLVAENGINGFYTSPEKRKECCYIRKVLPLRRALAQADLWITGLRRDHSASRQSLKMFEWDEDNSTIKFHPLLYFSTEAVMALVKQLSVPISPLHEKGFFSIGCAPCTRALQYGEPLRAGRWWWEEETKKECGLHHRS